MRSALRPVSGKCTGFTLMEVLVALSLLSIVTGMAYSFYLFAHKQVVIREKKAFEFDTALLLLESVAKNVRESRSTLLLEESQWVFLTKRGDTAYYTFSDGTLTFNKVELSLGDRKIPKVSFEGFGNDSLLDVNGDGDVDFEELDADGDDKLTGPELEKLSWIKCSLSLKEGEDGPLSTLESVKNNLAGDEDRFQTYF